MKTDYQTIRDAIEISWGGGKEYIICPYGDLGALTKRILNDSYGIKEKYIIDNKLSIYNKKIKNMEICKEINCNQYTVLLACANPDITEVLYNELIKYFPIDNIVSIFNYQKKEKVKEEEIKKEKVKCGKYSYGTLCDSNRVESIGAFCSFASGSYVVENHAVQYISTHPFLYSDKNYNPLLKNYDEYKNQKWYFPDVKPKGTVGKMSKVTIGNDVWLGQNVLITNGANIGNGVIAAAGAVITKDVPDYAVVAGVPARIIRYRYTKQQIDALNKIAWWDWSDEKIRENYDDFFLDIDLFIEKHLN